MNREERKAWEEVRMSPGVVGKGMNMMSAKKISGREKERGQTGAEAGGEDWNQTKQA